MEPRSLKPAQTSILGRKSNIYKQQAKSYIICMNSQELLKEALSLRPQDKTLLIDGLLSSLDEPDHNIDKIWHDEIEKRVSALKNGQLTTIPYLEI